MVFIPKMVNGRNGWQIIKDLSQDVPEFLAEMRLSVPVMAINLLVLSQSHYGAEIVG